jgi:hypothetical protein
MELLRSEGCYLRGCFWYGVGRDERIIFVLLTDKTPMAECLLWKNIKGLGVLYFGTSFGALGRDWTEQGRVAFWRLVKLVCICRLTSKTIFN